MIYHKSISLCFLVLCLIGCAQPKYQNIVSPTTNGSQESNNLKVECLNLFTQNNICLQWFFESGTPVAQKYTSIIVKLYRLNQYDQTLVYTDPESNTQLKVTPWMPSMSHGTVPNQITKLDIGTFRITNVNFIMSGPWEIYFDLIQNGQVERLTAKVDVP